MKIIPGSVLTGGAILVLAGAVVPGQQAKDRCVDQARADPAKEWPTYRHDPGGMRFVPLTEITPANVGATDDARFRVFDAKTGKEL